MTNRVRTDTFGRQRGNFRQYLLRITFNHRVDTKACNGLSAPVEKHVFIFIAPFDQRENRLCGPGPERASSFLIALTMQKNRGGVTRCVGRELDVGDPELCSLICASAAVIEKQQQCVVTAPL